MSWVRPQTQLEGQIIRLIPMQEEHLDELDALAADQRIWEFLSPDMSTREKRLSYLAQAFDAREAGSQYPFVIFHKKQQKLIGSTRLK
jgi:RimJ/RimL family protein N-acetyltransferase